MISLSSDESRVLGMLIEKATTTPEQYPLSMNAITNGSNQKSNRDPVRTMSEEECFDATESLRAKGLVVRVDQMGDRVPKFRHHAGEILQARAGELAILAELLLRGPQTIGELRSRATRMSPIETLESAQGLVGALSSRSEPLVKEIPPLPGSRALRYAQLLCPDLHAVEAPAAHPASAPDPLAERVTQLEIQLVQLKTALDDLRGRLGHKA